MTKREIDSEKLLFLAVLAQSINDEMEEEIGTFKFKLKYKAKAFLDESLKLMNQDFQSLEAVDQLVNLSVWVKDVFDIMIEVGKRTPLDQKLFQSDWEQLLEKYKLDNK